MRERERERERETEFAQPNYLVSRERFEILPDYQVQDLPSRPYLIQKTNNMVIS